MLDGVASGMCHIVPIVGMLDTSRSHRSVAAVLLGQAQAQAQQVQEQRKDEQRELCQQQEQGVWIAACGSFACVERRSDA